MPVTSVQIDTALGYISSALIAVGGTIGFLKKGSVPSLVAGVSSGAALGYGVYRASQDYKDVYLILGVSAILTLVMGRRLAITGKFFPAGLVTVLSIAILIRYGLRLL